MSLIRQNDILPCLYRRDKNTRTPLRLHSFDKRQVAISQHQEGTRLKQAGEAVSGHEDGISAKAGEYSKMHILPVFQAATIHGICHKPNDLR